MSHIKQQSAAGLLHVDGELAGEAVAHVVLGAHDVAGLGEDFRLMGFDPEQLGEGKVGQRRIAGELNQFFVADFLVQPIALRLRAGVAPDERGTKDRAVFVEQDGAVHLASEAECGDGLLRLGRSGNGVADGFLRGAPPILGILLRPAGMRRAKRSMVTGRAGDNLAFGIHDDGARAARSYIHSQEPHNVHSFM